jgi:hypothetical protein
VLALLTRQSDLGPNFGGCHGGAFQSMILRCLR